MLLETRFGALPAEVVQRVHSADTVTLETWGRRVLSATTLDQVFAFHA